MIELDIPACELRRGDYLLSARERGGHVSGGSTVLAAHLDGDNVTVRRAAGIHTIDVTYRATETVSVIRD